ncbi:MAG TPA: proline racemase family protein [Vicinamibacterales bacterium]|nr:proline racemase family protein [Vicinamibacterales bacterium]
MAARRIRTIDAHTEGEPLRLVVEGFPPVRGGTLLEKREWVRRRHDRLRRALMLEPRGHLDMYGALLTEPVTPGADAGVLFMHNEGYSTMCGHGVIAVVTVAIERHLIAVPPERTTLLLDTPAGPVRARFTRAGDRVERVAFVNVPAFVLRPGVEVRLGSRQVRADVAFGGAFYAVVDAEAAGLALDGRRLAEIRRAGMEIKRQVEAALEVVHPLEAGLRGVYGTIFTGPAAGGADLRNVTVFADAEIDRSPCGTGTCAVMAVLDAMGLLPEGHPFVHESLIGTRFRGRVLERTQVGGYPAIVPEIEGSAWITGEHTFILDERDPLRYGFRLE